MASLLVTAAASTSLRADETKVREAVGAYIEAFNKQDLDALAAMWGADATHTDRETGERTEGREAIRADIEAAFQQRPGVRLAGRVDRVRMVTGEVAQVEGQVTIALPDQEPSDTVFSAILVSRDGHWQIDSLEETPVAQPPTSYDALQELEWLVGKWVDESDDVRVETTVSWSANRAFLLRSFVTETAEDLREGTQVIGWDPRSREIRSWTFNSDGSFGDATWSKSGSDWLIKSRQTLADGQAASGTFVMTRIDDDTVSLQLIGHEVEGEPQPTKPAVRVARAAETAPAAAQDTPPTTAPRTEQQTAPAAAPKSRPDAPADKNQQGGKR